MDFIYESIVKVNWRKSIKDIIIKYINILINSILEIFNSNL